MLALATLLVACLGSPLAPSSSTGLAESSQCSGVRHTVLHDTASDGSLWAVGADWKAQFANDGAHFIPFLGSDAPHDVVVHFATSSVSVHGAPIEFARDAKAQCDGDTIRFARGAFDELYACATDGVEQTFVFQSLPARDELVVRCAVNSDLSAYSVGDHIEFQNERGGVRYSKAIAIDAAGRHTALTPELEDGVIVLRVPADFVRACELPLTIDPLIQVFGVTTTPAEEFAPDAASAVDGSRCVVWETAWSQTDHDVTARITDTSPSVDVTLAIDATTDYWSGPKVASIWTSKISIHYGVVASVGLPTSDARTVRMRTILGTILGYTPQAVTTLSTGIAGDHHAADIGGDPFFGGPDFFFVVWQRDLPSGDSDIYGYLAGAVLNVAVDPLNDDERPAVSKSDNTLEWFTVFERRAPAGDRDIYARPYDYAGAPASGIIPISTSPFDDTRPTVSCNSARFVFAYERDFIGQHDVMLQVFDGTTAAAPIDLMVLEGGANTLLDQRLPVVDGESLTGYLVAYKEADPAQPTLARTRLTSFTFDPQFQIVLGETHVPVGHTTSTRNRANVSSDAVQMGTSTPEFEVVWDERNAAGDNDVYGALFLRGATNGFVVAGCFGDGSNTACPCGSNGGAPAGCPNSAQSSGAELSWTGVVKLSADSFVVQAIRLPSSTTAVLVQADSIQTSAVVFGDGLRCLAGNQIRIATRVASAGALSYPQTVSDPRISVAGLVPAAGATRLYQYMYRDPANFCTAQTWNTTNALTVNWAP
jgi:hypothetical protein